MEISVVGAGVVGLTTAVCLAEAGQDVTVVADRRTPHTTSDVAAAIHYPFLAEPRDRVIAWARTSWHAFEALCGESAGVRMDWIMEVFAAGEPPATAWEGERVEAVPASEVPGGFGCAIRSWVPVVDMKQFMPYLEQRLLAAGGTIEERRLQSLAEVSGDGVVHCAGLGARSLVGDDRVRPVRGQVARLAADPGLRGAFLDQRPECLAYVIPFVDRVVVGGTAEVGDWNEAVLPRDQAVFLARAARLEPRVADLAVQSAAVGLRPYRDVVRLEREHLPDGRPVVHNYGHGGSGVTLSWGCALEARDLMGG